MPSLLRAEGRGRWVAVDLFAREIEDWRRVDPDLDLRVEDARRLRFADGSFDGCVSVSVVEHIPGQGDAEAMAEMWRVLRPGGVLHLTVPVANPHRDVLIDEEVYGEASARVDRKVFFARYYGEEELARRLLALPWEVEVREYVRQADPRIEAAFHRLAPWSYPLGFALRFVCPRNFRRIAGPGVLPPHEHGVVYLRLRRPGGER